MSSHLYSLNYVSRPWTALLSTFTLHRSNFSAQILSKRLRKPQETSKFLVYCNSLITKHGRNGNIKESESIFSRMPHKNTVSWTAMLTAYSENCNIVKAREMFDKMPERTTASYNAMITAYLRNGCDVYEAYRLFSKMKERNAVSFGAMITGFVQAGFFDKAEQLYAGTPSQWRDPVCSNALISGYLKVGRLEDAVEVFEGMVERDVVSWSSMVDGHCKKGRVEEARVLFDRMPDRNVVTWTVMINGYMRIGFFENGFGLFLSMRRDGAVVVNSTTLTVMFEACGNFGRYQEAIQMHGLVLRMGFDFDVFLGNSTISVYCKFGCIDEANRIFCMMSKKDVVSWNSLIAGFVQHRKIEEAYKLFDKMPGKDIVSWTTMISGFSSGGNTEKSIQLFRMMPEKDDVAWTAIISGLVSNGKYEKAFRWFIDMLQKAIRPNPLTLSSVLSASSGLATLNQGLQIHAYVLKMDMEFDLSIQNSLISMYSKCGNIADAYRIFSTINIPNIISFNSMIMGFAKNGLGKEALRLFRKMQYEGQEPDQITFLCVLSACSHMGLVEEGQKYFELMKSSYGIEPGPDHYACIVDLLGRVGLLDEAVDLIHSMPSEPHPGVWGALLGASRIHLRLDLAKLAAQQLAELEPDSATPYVVLSNVHNIAGTRNDGDQVRITQKAKGIRKSPGCSWIIVEDMVQ